MRIENLYIKYLSEPVVLIGEGEYNLDDLQEVKVTDSFLGLDRAVITCQNEQPFANCTTEQYLKSLVDECRCIPMSLGLLKKV